MSPVTLHQIGLPYFQHPFTWQPRILLHTSDDLVRLSEAIVTTVDVASNDFEILWH